MYRMISRNPVPKSLRTSNAQPMISSVISQYCKSDRRSSCKSCKSMFVSTVVSTGDGYAILLVHRYLRSINWIAATIWWKCRRVIVGTIQRTHGAQYSRRQGRKRSYRNQNNQRDHYNVFNRYCPFSISSLHFRTTLCILEQKPLGTPVKTETERQMPGGCCEILANASGPKSTQECLGNLGQAVRLSRE